MGIFKNKSKSGMPEACAPGMAAAYNMKRKKMAHGGMMTNDGYQSEGKGHTININVSPQGEYKPQMMAEGGVMKDLPAKKQEPVPDPDMVDQIMSKRAMYSEGGKVANEDSGESASMPDQMAKSDPNEFDDLALRDDLSFDYTGENSGDEDGSDLNQESGDMVDKIMRKRSRK